MALLCDKPQFALPFPIALLAAGAMASDRRGRSDSHCPCGCSISLSAPTPGLHSLRQQNCRESFCWNRAASGSRSCKSVSAAVRLGGRGVSLAYAAQGAASGLVICRTAWVWYTRDQHELKSALLIAATTLASPHLLDYDLVPLAPALAFLTCAILKEGLREYELSLMAFVWIAPLLARTVAGLAGTPLGLITTLTLFSLLAHRSLRERPLRAAHAFGIAQL